MRDIITVAKNELRNLFNNPEIEDKVILKKLLNGAKLNRSDLSIDSQEYFFLTTQNSIIGMYHFEKDRLICDVFLVEQ